MPGSSLWLLPPPTHPLSPLLTELINQTSSHFRSPHRFLPHVTLTNEISPYSYGSTPQAWLDSLPLPSGQEMSIRVSRLCSEDVFFRKLYLLVDKTDAVTQLARIAREVVLWEGEDKDAWAKYAYMPHLSLLYSDIPQVGNDGFEAVYSLARDMGMKLDGVGLFGGWVGGRVVLVPTDKEIKYWLPIAVRDL